MTTSGTSAALPALYVFLDEGGDLGFNAKGSKYFALTSITATRPFVWDVQLTDYKYDLLEFGLNLDHFHAAQDNSHVRRRVLSLINGMLASMRIDSVIVEKRKTGPMLQREDKFYPRMLGYLVRYVLSGVAVNQYAKVIVITDAIPLKGKRQAIEKAVKETLANMLPPQLRYEIVHHPSASCIGLQVADYCNWAIWKKWERGDVSSYASIQGAVRSEFDIFATGTRYYY